MLEKVKNSSPNGSNEINVSKNEKLSLERGMTLCDRKYRNVFERKWKLGSVSFDQHTYFCQ